MADPLFSILIPTRDRPVTFRHSLATALVQHGDDFEIVVADNCSSPAVAQIVKAAQSDRITYIRSDEILPMTQNWEAGLRRCRGEYITILGDDDGLVPSTLSSARWLLRETKAKILNWSPHTYWWPDTIVYWNSNRLVVKFGTDAHWYESGAMLAAFYSNSIGFEKLPMIYSSFVHKSCIESVINRHGAYFNLPQVPDVVSGILNLLETDRVLYSRRPLSVRGNSGKSNGTAQWARSLGAEQRETYFREEKAKLNQIIHQSLIPSPNLSVLIASIKLQCKDMFFPDRNDLNVNIGNLVHSMINTLNTDPDAYEDNLEEAMALAKKHRIDLDALSIPPKATANRTRFSGPIFEKDNILETLVIDGDVAGIQDVFSASHLADSMQPNFIDAYPSLRRP